jgi:hypothetical protein
MTLPLNAVSLSSLVRYSKTQTVRFEISIPFFFKNKAISDCINFFEGLAGQGRGNNITLFPSIMALTNSYFFCSISPVT